ncbi:MAG: bis(5'-nucleosyl)-tetraphosphatase [Candidatus Babeliales bacterium]
MKTVHSAGIIIYYQSHGNTEYLLLHYPSGHWEFPKGKLEKDETETEAALRELKEETGLDAVLNSHFRESITYFFKSFDGQTVQKTVDFFIGQSMSKQVTLSHEHQGSAWLPYEQALERLTYDNAKKVFIKAAATIKQ